MTPLLEPGYKFSTHKIIFEIVCLCFYRMDRKLRNEQSQQNRQLMNKQLEEWKKAVDYHTKAVSRRGIAAKYYIYTYLVNYKLCEIKGLQIYFRTHHTQYQEFQFHLKLFTYCKRISLYIEYIITQRTLFENSCRAF